MRQTLTSWFPFLPCDVQVTRVGVYSMMQQFISQLYALAENETLVPIGLEDVHFDFIYNGARRPRDNPPALSMGACPPFALVRH